MTLNSDRTRTGRFLDVALRDAGLLAGAMALWRPAARYAPAAPLLRRAPA